MRIYGEPLRLQIALASLIVYPPWIWLAMRTTHCLRFITRHTIPFTKRTIWLAKTLALVVVAGGLIGIPVEFGLRWYFALWPGLAMVFVALRESVQGIVVPEPPQNRASYHSSWQEFRRLRLYLRYAWVGLAISFGIVFALGAISGGTSNVVQGVIVGVDAIALLVPFGLMQYARLQLSRWPCPRCGRAFRGLWSLTYLPKRCHYCGLPRWEEFSTHSS